MRVQVAYGLGIRSEHRFQSLPEGDSPLALIDLYLNRADKLPELDPRSLEVRQAQGHNIYIALTAQSLFFRVGAFLEFRLSFDAQRIACLALNGTPEGILAYWFLQQVLPLYLLCSGMAECFHGMAVDFSPLAGDAQSAPSCPVECAAFLGGSYAGKSTLLGYLLSRGHSLVCDDHLAIWRKDYQTVLPAAPYYRPYRASQDLGHVASRFHVSPLPLGRIFILEPTFAYAEIESVELSGLAAIEAILPHILYNLHNPRMPELFPLVAERFRGLKTLVQQTTVSRLHVPRSLDRLPEVYDFILKDLVNQS